MIPGNINTDLISGDEGGYQISRSLRFNSADSAYLSRTPASAGNRKTWTWAGWVKNTCSTATTIPVTLLSARNGAGAGIGEFFWLAINNIFTAGGHQIAAGDGNVNYLVSTASFRDPSAWYHIVCAYDSTQATANNRLRLYVNGTEITVFNTNNRASLTQNSDGVINRTSIEHRMGLRISEYSNCYLADVHFIDGQALTPSSFTEVSATTGQLIPKQYTGSFGTNGFWLKFSDNSAATATTLGKDYSGNSNNWTPNNLSVTAGAGNDSLVDTPTNGSQTDTGVGGEVVGNYCTWNPLEKDATTVLSNGNLNAASIPGGAWLGATFAAASGKWYYEITTVTGQFLMLGVADYAVAQNSKKEYTNTGTYYYYGSNGQLRVNGVNTAFPDSNTYTFANNDVIGVAFDCDAGTVNFYRNGSKVGGASNSITGLSGKLLGPALSAGSGSQECIINAGQRPFAYTAPSGFKALCDTNLPAPVVAKPNTVMDVALYTGNGSTQTISGLGFSPDFVWIKGRGVAVDHQLYDQIRGVTRPLISNATYAEGGPGSYGLTAFNSNGFILNDIASGGYGVNGSPGGTYSGASAAYVAWAWDAGSSTVTNTQGSITSQVRANASAGFSIVTYTGTGANATVGHGLGVQPGLVVVKRRDSTGNWFTWHTSISATTYLTLNTTAATTTLSTVWNDTAPTSTVFSIGTSAGINTSSATYVAYCFAPVAGYSSFGRYTGNGSADGPFVWCGFRPRWILIKNASSAVDWELVDTARDTSNGPQNNRLQPNSSAAEAAGYTLFDTLSNGFKVRSSTSNWNGNTNTIIYAAFAENPFQYARAR